MHRPGENDAVALIGAGVPLHECLAAAEQLAEVGIAARVIDLYSVKPLERAMLIETCRATEGRLVVVQDHYPQGGISGEVMEALADAELDELHVTLLGVNGLPMSGQPAEPLDAAGIFARHIVAAARKLTEVREWTPTIRPTNPPGNHA
ncbi:transketolase C-terminal domain-containing protein [Salinibacterium xinjiangense]|uniref:transketolase C-terminal domain-containing protein n=1 Tax=Salinibacterium xinjiangense TaxID=386302 RepID=UPI00227CE604|nr:transketolase C-terminal domain-containing protein [Salinibacterium xinjiangense]